MKMPFGKRYRDQELNTLPDSYLRWIMREVSPRPPPTVRPENREQYVKIRRLLRSEAQRILRERSLNGVKVLDPPDGARS